ncbi:MAG: hypothetical protein R2795_01845 [Saprospiraceae bacterium]
MDIRLLRREEIDKTKWNSCIHYAFNGNIFGYMWYLDAMARDWDALVMDDYAAVLPLPRVAGRWGRTRIQQPPLTRELAIYAIDPPSDKRINSFWEALATHYPEVELTVDSFGQVRKAGWHNTTATNYFLPLADRYENLRERYSPTLLEQLSAAATQSWMSVSNLKPEVVAEKYRQAHPHISEAVFHGLQRIMYNVLHRGWGFVSGITDGQSEILAADFFIFSHGRMMSLAPFASERGKEIHAQAFLYDLIIRQQAGKPQSLDFNAHEDFAAFAEQFGAIDYPYYHVASPKRVGLAKFF